MVVIDEMKLQREPNAFYRWSKKGKTPKVKFERNKGQSVDFYGGLSLRDKQEIVYLSEDGQDSSQTIQFLEMIVKRYQKEIERRLRSHLKEIEKEGRYRGLILVILDGASFHRSQTIKDWLKKHYGIIELMRFPTYSPNLNPQEKVWKALRRHLAKVEGKYSFREIVDRACRFLLTRKFDYKFP